LTGQVPLPAILVFAQDDELLLIARSIQGYLGRENGQRSQGCLGRHRVGKRLGGRLGRGNGQGADPTTHHDNQEVPSSTGEHDRFSFEWAGRGVRRWQGGGGGTGGGAAAAGAAWGAVA